MTRSDDERVADILEAGATLAGIVSGGEALWREDEIRRLAAERLLEIVGESARAMSGEARARYPRSAGPHDAVAQVEIAIDAWLDAPRAEGRPLPEPSSRVARA